VVDPWFEERFLRKQRQNSVLRYELAPFAVIDAAREHQADRRLFAADQTLPAA
jgi:hypothetical protein